ncbi:O-antigen ligase family protein [uncultured Bilophila sp.]|uniref:O-antigen ligase family protein n=1 Tax=uncultured Bilophila sp. TaxID=529385 RepID=UPI00280C1A63|nr:O-antigen ligase family protein [uncultured Bilophila sp.]
MQIRKAKWVKSLFHEHSFFFISLCILFWWLGTGSLTWKRISIPLIIGGYYLWKTEVYRFIRCVPLTALLPIAAALYTMLTPGYLFADIRNGYEMLSIYLIGVMAILLLRDRYFISMLFLPIALAITYIGFMVGVFSKPMVSCDERLVLFLKHSNILGAVSAIALLFLVICFNKWKGLVCYVLSGIGCLIILILILSTNRAAYLAVFVCLSFLIFHLSKKRIISILIIVGICTFTVFILPQKQLNRIISLVESPLNDRTLETRKPIWEAGVAGIENAPWFGNSISTFKSFHNNYVIKNAEDLSLRYREVEKTAYHPHNIFIGLLFMYGIIGTALFIWSVGLALKKSLAQEDLFFQVIVIFYIIYGLFDFSLDREDGIVLLFFPMGLVYGREIAASLQRQLPAQHSQPCGAQAK